ncbi:MAG: kelch repeat-containing protein [Desulfobulbaceae bacterium]
MKHPATGPLPGNRLPFLTFVLLLAMFVCPLIGSTTPTAVPQSTLTQPWQTILNRSGSSLYPFRDPAANPAVHTPAGESGSAFHAQGAHSGPPSAVTNDIAAILETTPLWSSGAEMAHGRTGHSATLLPDGRVLVAGGWEEFDSLLLAGAEIYNPANNTWSDAGSMATARGIHAATLLPDGRVLVTGGVNWLDTMYASAELYDPATNSWSSAGTMNTPRCGHTATLLPDGRVLVAGGYNDINSLESTNSVDLYNPATNTWSAADTMAEGRAEHSTALLPDGRVLAAGGNFGNPLASAEVYDPAADSWSTAADMNYASYAHTSTVLPDGRVLIAGGGTDFHNTLGRVEVYDPAADSWNNAATMSINRESHTATLLPDGRVLVTGGALLIGGYEGIGSIGNLASTEIYDPASDTWSWAGDLSIARANHTATLLPDGRVFVVGGGNSFSSTELFDPANDSWNTNGEMVDSRVNTTATLLPDGKVFMAGGWNETGVLAAGEVYDPVAKTWASVGNMANGRTAHTSTLLPDGRVLVAGGFVEIAGTGALSSSELYDSISDSWSGAASFGTNRGLHTASLLPNGKVLIAGGRDAENDSLVSAEIYDPIADTWSSAASMASARDIHSAVLLQDSRVLVAGGDDTGGNTTLSSTELYDPSTNSWSAAGQMTTPRNQFSMVLLPDGRVFVAGGWNGTSVLSSAEVYDPATNAWSAAANMTEARGGSAMTLLPDGRVLVVGGWSGTAVLSSAEVYDPATDSWSEAGNLITARVFPAASLLADGQVLFFGGQDASGNILASAELYDVGLGYDDAWRPTVTSTPEPLYLYLPFSLSGTGFRGVGNTEASSGATSSSATNVPLVQLRSGLNGQVQWLRPQEFSAASYTGRPLSDFPPGPAWLTVFVNSIPSVAEYVQVALPYTVTAAVSENGRIDAPTPSPTGVVPGSNGTVQFTFTANDHHHIAAITGCGIDYTNTDNGVASLTVTTAPITGNCTVSALFAINRYTVSAIAGSNGSLDAGTPSPQEIDHGTTAQFTFRADTGSHIASISGCGINYLNSDQAVTIKTETTEGITDNCTVNGTFATNTYRLNVDVTGRGTGAVNSGSTGIDCPETCEEVFEHGTVVSLTALPDSPSTFKEWTGDCIGKDPGCTLTMDDDKHVTAEFYYFPWPMFLPALTVPVQP